MPRAAKITRGFAGAAGVIALLTVFSRFAGLLRKLAQSWAVSDGTVATAYDTANTVPNVLFEVAAGGALAGAVIPLISRFLARGEKEKMAQTASALVTWVLTVGLPISFLVMLCADSVTGMLFGKNADPGVVRLASFLLRLFALQIPLYGLSVVFTGILQAHRKFVLPALSPLLSSVTVIAVFCGYAGYVGHLQDAGTLPVKAALLLGLGTTLGVVLFSLPQLIPVLKICRLSPTWKFPPGVARRTVHLAGAGLAALSAQQIVIVMIMYFANAFGGVGAYTTFSYAFSIFMVPYAVLAVPVATAVFPRISAAAEMGRNRELCLLVAKSTKLVLLLGFAAAALLAVLALPAKIVLELGRNIAFLDFAMWVSAPALVGYSLLYHGARVLYALHLGRKVVWVNTLAWGAAAAVLLLAPYFGVHGRFSALAGIGAALSIGMTVGVFFTYLTLCRIFGRRIFAGYTRMFGILCVLLPFAVWGGRQCVETILLRMGPGIFGVCCAVIAGTAAVLIAVAAAVALTDREILNFAVKSDHIR